jgi:hypothetical protein
VSGEFEALDHDGGPRTVGKEYGQPKSTGVDIDIPLARQELASLIALASQSRYLTATP